MSYVVQSPVAPAATRRPATVRTAAALLVLMALVGVVYAITTLAIAPGVVDRFRDASSGAQNSDVDAYVTVVWIGAALGAVLAMILLALYVVLALALRRGSNAARIGTWVACGLGVLFGFGSITTVAVQRAGEDKPGTLGFALSEAYPGPWISLNVGLSIAQVVGYAAVAVLLIRGPRAFFGRDGAAAGSVASAKQSGAHVALPTYGSATGYPHARPAQATGTSQPPSVPPSPGPDDDYWARPSS